MNLALSLAIFVGAALISGLLVEVIRRWMLRREYLDKPNERSSHTVPTPRGGGLAIVVVTLTGWILINVFVWHRFDWSVWAYPLGAGLIAAVSWIDDLRPLPNSVRFAAHSFAALLSMVAYDVWQQMVLFDDFMMQLGAWGALVTFLWITWLTNAYNFMDGIDGIAGTQAFVAGLGWCLIHTVPYANQTHISGIMLLGLLIAGSSLGFLFHNRPPARIFMGDVGSAFLGFSFAVTPLLLNTKLSDPVMGHIGPIRDSFLFVPAILIVWPFLFDTIFTFVRRALKGENVFKAHRSHLFQRLVIAGRSHRFVTLLYGTLAVGGAWLALEWIKGTRISPTQIYLPLLSGMFGLWAFTRWCEMRKLRAAAHSEI